MNNKGFAITAVLYSVLILFILILVSFLAVLSNKNTLLYKAMDSINNTIDMDNNIDINHNILTPYLTTYRGKYMLTSKNCTANIYLPINTTLMYEGVDQVKLNETVVNICNNTGSNNLYYFVNIVTRSGATNDIVINNVLTSTLE